MKPSHASSFPLSNEERRKELGHQIHNIWTNGGSDPSGLAPALFDGRIEALAWIVIGQHPDDKLHQHDPGSSSSPGTIDRVHCRDLSYSDFVSKYMRANRPVIIQGLADDWKARRLWLKRDKSTGRLVPNMKVIGEEFGDQNVPVAQQSSRGFGVNRPVACEMSVAEYVAWWEVFHAKEQNERHHDSSGNDNNSDDTLVEEPVLYLKDWKFVVANPSYDAYQWPIYFQDDWLNQAMGNAYKFVYLGPKGTSTVLHADVLRSFSWSTNVCGRKRWYLIPPTLTYLLFDCFGKTLASHLHVDVDNGQDAFYPGLEVARQYAICVDQIAGETIFVPSCWYHTVENLEATLSINHNWLNGSNIHHSWEKLESEALSLHRTVTTDDNSASTEVLPSLNSKGGESQHDNSQVDDDLMLFWHVVSKRFNSILNALPVDTMDDQVVYDLKAIQYVMKGLERLVTDGYASTIAQRSDCDVEGLRKMVDKTLSFVAESRPLFLD